jgi:hypothetical protein
MSPHKGKKKDFLKTQIFSLEGERLVLELGNLSFWSVQT